MKLLIKQRVFSWTDTYDIYDETGAPKYYVKAEFLTLGHQIHVYERSSREVGFISQKVFQLMPQFEIFAYGRSQGLIRKEFTLFHPRYHVECRGWSVQGDVFGWDYNVMEQNHTVAHISKELFRWGDTYVISYARPEDEIMVLLLVIAIDAANCSNN